MITAVVISNQKLSILVALPLCAGVARVTAFKRTANTLYYYVGMALT